MLIPEVGCVDAAVTRSRSELAVRDRETAREGSGRQARSRTWPASGRRRHRSAVRRAEPDSRRRCVNATATWGIDQLDGAKCVFALPLSGTRFRKTIAERTDIRRWPEPASTSRRVPADGCGNPACERLAQSQRADRAHVLHLSCGAAGRPANHAGRRAWLARPHGPARAAGNRRARRAFSARCCGR